MTDTTNDGGALRKQLEKVLADNKALTEKLSGLETKERTRSIESALAEKGLNPKLARFVSAEDGSDPTKLDAWIKENAELFGSTSVREGGSEDPGKTSVDEDSARAYGQMQQVSQSGSHATPDAASLAARIKAAKNPAELNALLASISGQM